MRDREKRPVTIEPVVLASSSPRRKELLDQMQIPCIVEPAAIDESSVVDSDPALLARRLAVKKAVAVREGSGGTFRSSWVLGADTVVVVGKEILGKPTDRDDARRMMRELSGTTHRVITGLALTIPGEPTPVEDHAETQVCFAALSDAELSEYLMSDDWQGVAGAYRIQGLSARFVQWISGSYSNVVGLPIHLLYSILRAHNYPVVG